MAHMTRPAWGCLDGEEMRAAAMGRAGDPGIREHLSRCAECRRAVHDLRPELGQTGRHREPRRGSSLLGRPAFWLVLLAMAVGAVGVVMFGRRSQPPKPVTSAPAAVSADPPPVRRVRNRARRSGPSPSIDAEIVATVRRNQGGVRICYERALKRNEGLTLRLDVNVSVRSSGVVEQVSIDGPGDASAVTTCIRNVVKTWQFPRSPEAYRSTFPLRLQPSQ
jgi:hypothetical protein